MASSVVVQMGHQSEQQAAQLREAMLTLVSEGRFHEYMKDVWGRVDELRETGYASDKFVAQAAWLGITQVMETIMRDIEKNNEM